VFYCSCIKEGFLIFLSASLWKLYFLLQEEMHLLKSKDSKALQVRYSKISVKLVILISKRLFCYAAPSISQN
jgi:hypothetical protein